MISPLVICHRSRVASWHDGTTWRPARRIPLGVFVSLAPSERARAERHLRHNPPSRTEVLLATLRRALPRILESR